MSSLFAAKLTARRPAAFSGSAAITRYAPLPCVFCSRFGTILALLMGRLANFGCRHWFCGPDEMLSGGSAGRETLGTETIFIS